jgi:hypothetical protein
VTSLQNKEENNFGLLHHATAEQRNSHCSKKTGD